MKENLKIRVDDDNRQEVIDLLGKLGKSFCWDVKTRWSEIAAIFAYKKQNLEWGRDLGYNYFKGHSNKEITLPELRELARPKEYLNDKFELVVTNQPDDGWRLVPDGAEYFTEYSKLVSHLFWKTDENISYCYPTQSSNWVRGDMSMAEYIKYWTGTRILWQRENKVETVKGRFLHQWAYEAFGRGEELEFLSGHPQDGWKEFIPHIYVTAAFDDKKWQFRLKPQTIQIGSRTITKPISVKPETGTEYFMPSLSSSCKYLYATWDDSNYDKEVLGRSLCHLTKEDAIAYCNALLELMNSNYDKEVLGRSLCHLTKEDAIAYCNALLELMK